MPEWSIGAVSKTVVPFGTQGSNPCLSAIGVDYQVVADFVHGVTHRSLILLLLIYGRTGFLILVRLLFYCG